MSKLPLYLPDAVHCPPRSPMSVLVQYISHNSKNCCLRLYSQSCRSGHSGKEGKKAEWEKELAATVLNLRTTASQKCEAVPMRARI